MGAERRNGGRPSHESCEPPDAAAFLVGGRLQIWVNRATLTDPEAERATAALIAAARKGGHHGGL